MEKRIDFPTIEDNEVDSELHDEVLSEIILAIKERYNKAQQ